MIQEEIPKLFIGQCINLEILKCLVGRDEYRIVLVVLQGSYPV